MISIHFPLLQAAMVAGALMIPVLITLVVMFFLIFVFLNKNLSRGIENPGGRDVIWVLSVAVAAAITGGLLYGFFKFLDAALVTS